MRLDMSYDRGFVDLYNSFTYTDKGKRYLDMMGISREKLDPASMGKLYFTGSDEDRTVDVNANVGSKSKSPNNWQSEVFKGLGKLNSLALLYKQLNRSYSEEDAHDCINELITGGLYFHDLSGNAGVTIPYCWAWSCAHAMHGRKYGQLQSKPPKRSDSFIAVLIESIFDLAHEQAGALAIPDIFVCLAYYYKKENVDLTNDTKKIENDYQRIIHSLNQTYRIGGQSAFTNVSIMDRPTLDTTFKDWAYLDGSKVDIDYVTGLQNIFMKFMAKKDPTSGIPYRFPITTINIHTTNDNIVVDQSFLDDVCVYNKEGIFNLYITKGNAKLASCCRLLNDTNKLREFSRLDSFGNAGLSIGSARVVTVNLVRIGRQAIDEENYFEILDIQLERCKKLLLAHRSILKEKIKQDFLKFFSMGWLTLERMFSTIGIIGLWESLKGMGYNIRDDNGINFACKLFEHIEMRLDQFSTDTDCAFNLEQIPAEGAAVSLSKMDKNFFNDTDYRYHLYSNQFVPLFEDVDLLERAEIDGKLCSKMTGGSICHLNIGTSATPSQMKDLINFAISKGLEHFALNPSFNVCENEHITLGKSSDVRCPTCNGNITDNYTRVVGYFTGVSDWNKARRKYDYPNRTYNYIDEIDEKVA